MADKYQPEIPKAFLQSVDKQHWLELLAIDYASRKRKLLNDTKAQEVVNRLDLMGLEDELAFTTYHLPIALRTVSIDRWVCQLLSKLPNAVVIELGTGFSTRYNRLSEGRHRWYQVGSSDVYLMWKYFFNETESCTFIISDELEEDWLYQFVHEIREPVIILLEGQLEENLFTGVVKSLTNIQAPSGISCLIPLCRSRSLRNHRFGLTWWSGKAIGSIDAKQSWLPPFKAPMHKAHQKGNPLRSNREVRSWFLRIEAYLLQYQLLELHL